MPRRTLRLSIGTVLSAMVIASAITGVAVAAHGSSEGDGDRRSHAGSAEDRLQALPSPATFEVTIEATNSPVAVGETLEAHAVIENTGDEAGKGDVEFLIDGDVIATEENVTLDPGERRAIELAYDTSALEPRKYELVGRTADDEVAEKLTVRPPETHAGDEDEGQDESEGSGESDASSADTGGGDGGDGEARTRTESAGSPTATEGGTSESTESESLSVARVFGPVDAAEGGPGVGVLLMLVAATGILAIRRRFS